MARDWEAYEAKIREDIDRKMARAAERVQRHEERVLRRAELLKMRAEDRARRAQERAQRHAGQWDHVGFVWQGFPWKGFPKAGCEQNHSGAWVGIVIVALGFGLLLQNFGILPFREFIDFWPIILIVAGGMRIGKARFASARAFGVFLLITGIILLLQNLGVVRMSWEAFWPAILIFVGLKHLLRNYDPPVQPQAAAAASAPPPPSQPASPPPSPSNPLGDWNTVGKQGPETPASGPRAENMAASSTATTTTALGPDVYLHEYCIFTGGRRKIACDNFRGGELVACFGGIDVDLRNCIMGGSEATIDVTAAFGGCTIRVPLNWYVEMRCVSAFGGSSNKTIPPRGGPGQVIPKLVITGSAAFGGVVIEN